MMQHKRRKLTKRENDKQVKEVEEEEDMDAKTYQELVMQQNRKKKKSGGFQSMGLSHSVFTGITRKGYKIPTPVQRKCIPLIMDGKDVVAMARTGSGKTAAFLIPLFEKLKTHVSTGCRSLILSPTRELALQTLKFTKEIGKYTGLKAAVILGGDRIEDQFAALHENPDVIIATPGRFMHVLVEMDAKLKSVEYLVFDEADRLFEMGFQEQLHEIMRRLPDSRQTLLFSATLPKLLVEFARAGLHDPTLVRLDVDTKLSENLKLSFLQCRSEDRLALLLYLLKRVIKPEQQTVIFVATKHHAEYLNMIMGEAGIPCSYTYSSLDATARKINVAKFRNKKTNVLLVTDLAARGIDIPMLDNVINYNFPAKPKLFVHRVGRVARAGQSGTAFSLVSPDEMPFVCDLHLFLGRPLTFVPRSGQVKDTDGLFGCVPQAVVDTEDENLREWRQKTDLKNMEKVILNAYSHYIRSRPAPSTESVKRMKHVDLAAIGSHPLFRDLSTEGDEARQNLLDAMKNYKPNNTIFEVNSTSKNQAFGVMKKKREFHSKVIDTVLTKKRLGQTESQTVAEDEGQGHSRGDDGSTVDLMDAFSEVVSSKRPTNTKITDKKKKSKKMNKLRRSADTKQEDFYVEYRPSDYQSEKGLVVGSSFENEIKSAAFDLLGDDSSQLKQMNNSLKWDRKRKKFVRDGGKGGNQKKIKTESGQWIAASYKSNIYEDWLKRSKAPENAHAGDSGEDDDTPKGKRQTQPDVTEGRLQILGGGGVKPGFHRKGAGDTVPAMKNKFKSKGNRRELKRPEQILKQRRVTAKKEAQQKHRTQTNKKRKAPHGKGKKG